MTFSIDYKLLGARIARYRNAAGYRADDFANKIGLTKNNYSKIERGRQSPSVLSLLAICNELDISPDILMQDDTKETLIPAILEYCRVLDLTLSAQAVQNLNKLFEQQVK